VKCPFVSAEIKGDVQLTHEMRSPLRNGNRQGNYNNAPRCGAKTRAGTACKRAAMRNKDGIHTRCPLHGGKCTGARTAEGRERIGKANLKHGKSSIETKEARRLLRGARAFERYLSDVTGQRDRQLLMQECAARIDQALAVSDDKELVPLCRVMIDLAKADLDPLAKFWALMGREPDRRFTRFAKATMKVFMIGAEGKGCQEFRKHLPKL